MFYNNLFVKNYSKKNIKFFSVQQLYILYKLFGGTYTKLYQNKPTLFYSYIYIILYNFNFLHKYLFLSMLYFFKTNNTNKVIPVTDYNFSLTNNKYIFSPSTNGILFDFNTFWKKWKKLKRPKTDSDVLSYYLDDFKKKLNTYVNLGLIGVYSTYIIAKYKASVLSKFVKIDKPLLISPKYSSSTVHKHLNNINLNIFEFQFLRKNKIYNKGRYSRTRQNYRTGVYLCMYVSVLSIFGLYYWFYKFSFNFTYLWWFFIAFVASFFFPKIVKYRLYEPTTLLSKFYDFFRWVTLLIKSFF